ncbi:PIN domain-containing protein [Gillisia sp. M10.2A]|uniref:PIN domain-containing protein n=1 Tax=Gillisia lutea TaxID=2909668 RepID=A0ABS9EAY5_9FLAO|nr:PIN domain-containing protein [Gillisia lutea]MCF4100040.1 PIN domain-containing protein [Gillisia lutea]
MKNKFPGYSRKTEEEINEIWENGIICFDANVLLNLYRYSNETRETLLNLIGKFKDKIWLPHQSALEYNRNRYEVIADQEKAYKEFTEKISQIQKDLQSTSKPPFLSEEVHKSLNKVFEKVSSEVDESILKYSDFLKNDPIYDTISSLFEKRITDCYDSKRLEEIYKEGEERYNKKIPPGYEDAKNKEGNRKYGDLIIWKQIIDKAKELKKSIILITDERKTDWWWKIKDGRNMGPRQELVEELYNQAESNFHMYSSERFLSYGQGFLQEQVNKKALEEIQEMKRAEMEEIRRLKRLEEKKLNRQIHRSDKSNFLKRRYVELSERIKDVENFQNSLEIDALENTDAQEHIHNLSIHLAELNEERNELRKELDLYLLKKDKSQENFRRFFNNRNDSEENN